ncbi:MAG: N-acetylglucosamine kinase [Cetobacterium sp.]|uniref:N-acetylglucosamine kinase n=1 Tax=Cetobacterium sp. TaxID=2071632 RepID=UPI003F35C337
MEYILGVDGGGTKTTATLYSERMEVLGHFKGGPMNLQILSEDKIEELFREMLNYFNLDSKKINIGVGAAGAGREIDKNRLKLILEKIGFKKIAISNDGHIGILSVHGNKNGMILISGTGSMGLAVKDGNFYRKGGWGHILGDEGSGYYLGISLGKKIFEYLDEEEMFPENLLSQILEETNTKNIDEFLKWIYGNNKGEIAKLSNIVLKNSEEKICREIIDKAIEDLKNIILKLHKSTGLTSIGFIGGIIENETIIRKRLLLELKQLKFKFVEKKYSKEYGATLLLKK